MGPQGGPCVTVVTREQYNLCRLLFSSFGNDMPKVAIVKVMSTELVFLRRLVAKRRAEARLNQETAGFGRRCIQTRAKQIPFGGC